MAINLALLQPPGTKLSVEQTAGGLNFLAELQAAGTTIGSVSFLVRWIELVGVVFFAGFVAAAISARHYVAGTWLVAVWAPNHIVATALFIAALALFIGSVLAFWKQRQKFTYGLCEVVFGTMSTFQIAMSLWPNGEPAKFLALGSALYVISRGAGNLTDAFSREALLKRLTITVGGTDAMKVFAAAVAGET